MAAFGGIGGSSAAVVEIAIVFYPPSQKIEPPGGTLSRSVISCFAEDCYRFAEDCCSPTRRWRSSPGERGLSQAPSYLDPSKTASAGM